MQNCILSMIVHPFVVALHTIARISQSDRQIKVMLIQIERVRTSLIFTACSITSGFSQSTNKTDIELIASDFIFLLFLLNHVEQENNY